MYRDIKIIAVKYTVIRKLFHFSDLQILIILMRIGFYGQKIGTTKKKKD